MDAIPALGTTITTPVNFIPPAFAVHGEILHPKQTIRLLNDATPSLRPVARIKETPGSPYVESTIPRSYNARFVGLPCFIDSALVSKLSSTGLQAVRSRQLLRIEEELGANAVYGGKLKV